MTEATETPQTVQISLFGQYVRDLSFENPNAPQIFQPTTTPPTIDVNVSVQSRPLETNTYEVTLNVKLTARTEKQTTFIVDLAYAGKFGVAGVPEEPLKNFLFVEAPRLLFPFARSIIATAVRDGGFPEVLLNPIDFAMLYQQQQQHMQQPAQGAA